MNFVDRQILGVLLQPIKRELNLTDVQLGLLSGLSFAVLYAVLGVPAARWADRGNRRNFLSLAIAVFSAFTALSSIVTSYVQLVLARVCVGVGEAGGGPPALSMLADFYPPQRRASAMGIFASGTNIGMVVGLLAGGWISQLYGWRVAFLAVGVPGVIVALLVRFTVPEPQRRSDSGVLQVEMPTLAQTARTLLKQRSVLLITLATAISAISAFGVSTWFPAYLVRSHHMSQGQVGSWMALIVGVFGGLGAWLPPWAADRYMPQQPGRKFWIPAGLLVVAVPCMAIAASATSATIALAAYSVPAAAAACYLGASFSLIQTVVPPRMRAMAIAVLQWGINIIGLAMGPWIVGAISDGLRPSQGPESLRFALFGGSLFWLVGAALFLIAGRQVSHDVAAIRSARSP